MALSKIVYIRNHLERLFPAGEMDFFGSSWWHWEKRIRDGHKAEDKRISELANKHKGDENDYLAEDYWQMHDLTNSMYAAIIVSIWSNMEHGLKQTVATCAHLLGLDHGQIFEFGKIKDFFKNELSIGLETLREYDTVNAIRILNNSFKHSDGYYKPDNTKPHMQIEQSLLKKWNIKEDEKIDYPKLSIEELVLACATFNENLITTLEPKLK